MPMIGSTAHRISTHTSESIWTGMTRTCDGVDGSGVPLIFAIAVMAWTSSAWRQASTWAVGNAFVVGAVGAIVSINPLSSLRTYGTYNVGLSDMQGLVMRWPP